MHKAGARQAPTIRRWQSQVPGALTFCTSAEGDLAAWMAPSPVDREDFLSK